MARGLTWTQKDLEAARVPRKGETVYELPKEKEARIQRRIMELATLHGALAVRFNSGAFKVDESRFFRCYVYFIGKAAKSAGLPDVILFRGGRFCMLEVKREGKTLRKAQEVFARYAGLFGVKVHVVDSSEGAMEIMKKELDLHR